MSLIRLERAYVDSLRAEGRAAVELRELEGSSAVERTVTAMHPGERTRIESFRVDDFAAYYRLVRGRLEQTTDAGPRTDTYRPGTAVRRYRRPQGFEFAPAPVVGSTQV